MPSYTPTAGSPQEFQRVAVAINSPSPSLMLAESAAPPDKILAGTHPIVFAINPWAATLAGVGFYGWTGAAWAKLN
jgi:hypothetical protein